MVVLCAFRLRLNGGEEKIRTSDARLFRPALYQLSYLPNENEWRRIRVSNSSPPVRQTGALPNELMRHSVNWCVLCGFEPTRP